MRYHIAIPEGDNRSTRIADVNDIRDALALLDRHPDAYIYDEHTGAVL